MSEDEVGIGAFGGNPDRLITVFEGPPVVLSGQTNGGPALVRPGVSWVEMDGLIEVRERALVIVLFGVEDAAAEAERGVIRIKGDGLREVRDGRLVVLF